MLVTAPTNIVIPITFPAMDMSLLLEYPQNLFCLSAGGERRDASHRSRKIIHMTNSEEQYACLEALRFGKANGEPAPRPEHFDHRYKLPEHRIKKLQTLHPHPKDTLVEFFEEPHIYTIRGIPTTVSVSGMSHDYCHHFVPEREVDQLPKSRREAWPRLKYVVGATRILHVDDFSGDKGGIFFDPTSQKTLSACGAMGEGGIVMYQVLHDWAKASLPGDLEMWTFERSMTRGEILEGWDKNGEDARNRGTEAHLQMELWWNSEPVRFDDEETVVGMNFLLNTVLPSKALAYRTEWEIGSEKRNIGGCIDLVIRMPDGSLFLIDWKRTPKLEANMTGFKKLKAPLQHLDDCNGCAYALQLGCYQFILEDEYDERVSGRALVSIHPDKPFETSVPYLRDEVRFLMDNAEAAHACRERLSALPENQHLLCASTKLLALDPVRSSEGELLDRKVAMLRGVPFEPCPEPKKAVEDLLKSQPDLRAPVPTFEESWKKRFRGPKSVFGGY
jgi:hypothetical protein